jgi:DNA-nicking Smr family endonuclease
VTDEEESEAGEGEPVELAITDALDLHAFAPRDVPEVVEAWLDACAERGFHEVRVVHGKGTGFQRRRVEEVLRRHPAVESFRPADERRGGWGATMVVLKSP